MENHYPVQYQPGKEHEYWFVSIGKRNVIKCIHFSVIDLNTQLYNLSLVDWQIETLSLSDKIITNNGDTSMVLNTVAYGIYCFFQIIPDATIYFSGNSNSRNRLYRMQINNNRELWEHDYQVDIIQNSENEIGFYCKKKVNSKYEK